MDGVATPQSAAAWIVPGHARRRWGRNQLAAATAQSSCLHATQRQQAATARTDFPVRQSRRGVFSKVKFNGRSRRQQVLCTTVKQLDDTSTTPGVLHRTPALQQRNVVVRTDPGVNFGTVFHKHFGSSQVATLNGCEQGWGSILWQNKQWATSTSTTRGVHGARHHPRPPNLGDHVWIRTARHECHNGSHLSLTCRSNKGGLGLRKDGWMDGWMDGLGAGGLVG